MKLKAKVTINLGLYMDIRPEIEIDVPDDLKNEALVQWLHMTYHGLLTNKPKQIQEGEVDTKKSKDEGMNTAISDFGDQE